MKKLTYNDWRKIQNVFDAYKQNIYGAVNMTAKALLEKENQERLPDERLGQTAFTEAWNKKREALMGEFFPNSITIPNFIKEEEITQGFVETHAKKCVRILTYLLEQFPEALQDDGIHSRHSTHNAATNLLRSYIEIAGKPDENFLNSLAGVSDKANAPTLRDDFIRTVQKHETSMHRSNMKSVAEIIGMVEVAYSR